ncbi:hypothetical protein N7513_003628 [Penicillium frequentans]|nr:hypothetical protein N7513_003628 [Penicillium glabrum]
MRWYEQAEVCYAFLVDVPPQAVFDPDAANFLASKWFTRSWTLQELLAPWKLVFFAQDWSELFHREDKSSSIASITHIQAVFFEERPRDFDLRASLDSISIAARMSWASKRKTTRKEDRAYSLLGIFGINMPLLYGEGEAAFLRLQEEIIRRSDDMSFLLWNWNGKKGNPESEQPYDQNHVRIKPISQFAAPGAGYASRCGALATSPSAFSGCGYHGIRFVGESPFTITNKGLSMKAHLLDCYGEQFIGIPVPFPIRNLEFLAVPVQCVNGTYLRVKAPIYGVDTFDMRTFQSSLTQLYLRPTSGLASHKLNVNHPELMVTLREIPSKLRVIKIHSPYCVTYRRFCESPNHDPIILMKEQVTSDLFDRNIHMFVWVEDIRNSSRRFVFAFQLVARGTTLLESGSVSQYVENFKESWKFIALKKNEDPSIESLQERTQTPQNTFEMRLRENLVRYTAGVTAEKSPGRFLFIIDIKSPPQYPIAMAGRDTSWFKEILFSIFMPRMREIELHVAWLHTLEAVGVKMMAYVRYFLQQSGNLPWMFTFFIEVIIEKVFKLLVPNTVTLACFSFSCLISPGYSNKLFHSLVLRSFRKSPSKTIAKIGTVYIMCKLLPEILISLAPARGG